MSDEEEDRKPAAREKVQPQSPRRAPSEFTVVNPSSSVKFEALPLYRATSEPAEAAASVGGRPRRTASPIPEARLPMRKQPPGVAKMPPPAASGVARAATVGGSSKRPPASS
ncbi:MAG: hypothetical protein SGARI_007636, partial [Bacillariaceae sp.]